MIIFEQFINKTVDIKTDSEHIIGKLVSIEKINGKTLLIIQKEDNKNVVVSANKTDILSEYVKKKKPKPKPKPKPIKKPEKKPQKEFCNYCGKELDKNDPEYKYNPYGSSGVFCCREHWVETVDPNREFFKKKKVKKKC